MHIASIHSGRNGCGRHSWRYVQGFQEVNSNLELETIACDTGGLHVIATEIKGPHFALTEGLPTLRPLFLVEARWQ
jgi:hypothetical protein